ncbi:hypothetical protein Tco_1171949 [Tanacetum coccineum]
MVFGRPFIDETGLVYNKERGTVMFEQNDEKITFKMTHTIEIFRQTKLMGLSTDSIPPFAHEENFGHGRTHYYQSLLIRDEYKQDGGDRRGIRHLMRLEKEMMDNKGEVTPHGRMILASVEKAKDIWEKIKLLMQGTSLTKQERECKLYDEFDKFTYKKGESLHEYYLRFTLLLNDMNIYKMPLEQFQVNTKFLNTLPAEWSKFVNDVKLVKDLHTTNVD